MEDEKKELSKQKDLLLLKESHGGKILIEQLESEVEGLLTRLLRTFTSATHIELLAIIAQLEATNNILKTLIESEQNVAILKQEIDEQKDK